MSWIRSSKSTAVLALLVVTVAAFGTAAAVTVDSTNAPEEARVGTEITVSATMSDLYNESNSWTLEGTSQLRNVTGWEVTKTLPNGTSTTTTFEGQQNFSIPIEEGENLDTVSVTITGDVPPIESFVYRPRQTFLAGEFTRVVGGNENRIERIEIHHFTNRSHAVREKISTAEQAVNGSNSQEARDRLNTSISAFNSGSFDAANSSAQDARDTAESAEESQQTTQLLLMGGGAVVVLLLIVGGIYWYRSQQDDYDKLR